MKVKCPQCRKETEWENNLFRPFCSERCKLIDLGYWIEGHYYLPSEEDIINEKKSDKDRR